MKLLPKAGGGGEGGDIQRLAIMKKHFVASILKIK